MRQALLPRKLSILGGRLINTPVNRVCEIGWNIYGFRRVLATIPQLEASQSSRGIIFQTTRPKRVARLVGGRRPTIRHSLNCRRATEFGQFTILSPTKERPPQLPPTIHVLLHYCWCQQRSPEEWIDCRKFLRFHRRRHLKWSQELSFNTYFRSRFFISFSPLLVIYHGFCLQCITFAWI